MIGGKLKHPILALEGVADRKAHAASPQKDYW
jgi:hypothetical protein